MFIFYLKPYKHNIKLSESLEENYKNIQTINQKSFSSSYYCKGDRWHYKYSKRYKRITRNFFN